MKDCGQCDCDFTLHDGHFILHCENKFKKGLEMNEAINEGMAADQVVVPAVVSATDVAAEVAKQEASKQDAKVPAVEVKAE